MWCPPGVLMQAGEVLKTSSHHGVRLSGGDGLAAALAGPLVPVVRTPALTDSLLTTKHRVLAQTLTAPAGHQAQVYQL